MLACLLGCLAAVPVCAMETLTFRYRPYPDAEAKTLTASGRLLASDSAGNRFLETDDGARHLIAADDIVREWSDERPFEPVAHEVMGERLLADLPSDFRVHTTKRYVIAYDTSREYAEWTSSLLEGLYKALTRYWKKQGIELEEPRFPLPIVIHSSAKAYQAEAKGEGVGKGVIGYYHLKTNRVRMFDLTGAQEMRSAGLSMRRGSRSEISRMLSAPVAGPLVATIVHEATHQVCFNTGLLQRMADLPLWLVEGMAVYFEAPQAGSNRGWRGIGKMNERRMATFLRNLPKWNESSLTSLIGSDDRLRDPRTAGAAYADAWALNYYLIKRRSDDYVAYVKKLGEREPLEGPPATETDAEASRRRIALFTEHFGELREMEADFLEGMRRWASR